MINSDAPIFSKPDDLLGRWSLAVRIYDAISQSPLDHGLRTAVYGKWGEGKTSVMNLIKSLARKNNDVIFHFSPWRHRTTKSLWRHFIVSLCSALEEGANVTIPRNLFLSKMPDIQTGAGAAEIGTLLKDQLPNEAEKLLELLSELLTPGSGNVPQLLVNLGSRRLIVFVDDLDRTAPDLIPELLYSFHDILQAPRIVFVMSLDPDMISSALERENRNWGGSPNFLEKIVDVPFRLNDPPPHAWARFAKEFLCSDNVGFVSPSNLEAVFPFLPRNPRAIKKFARHLATLQKDVIRAAGTRVSVEDLLKVELFRSEFPELTNLLNVEGITELDVVVERTYGRKRHRPSYPPLREQLTKRGVDVIRQERALRLLESMEYTDEFPGISSSARRAMRFLDDPDPVTPSDLLARITSVRFVDGSTVRQWIGDISDRRNELASRVIESMFLAAVQCRSHHVRRSWNTNSDDSNAETQLTRKELLSCMEVLVGLERDCQVLGEPLLSRSCVREFLNHLCDASVFRESESEVEERESEEHLALNLLQCSALHLHELYSEIEHVHLPYLDDRRKHFDRFRLQCFEALDSRMAKELQARLDDYSRLAEFLSGGFEVLRRFILRDRGPLATGALQTLLSREPNESVPLLYCRVENGLRLLRSLIGQENDGLPHDFPIVNFRRLVAAASQLVAELAPEDPLLGALLEDAERRCDSVEVLLARVNAPESDDDDDCETDDD